MSGSGTSQASLGTEQPSSRLSEVKAPLVIGIAGHRDLRDEDLPTLSNAIKSIFLELKSQYKHTPLILLSALAEGADRLAAWVALSKDVGACLLVPLPMEQSIYEQDFDRDSLVEFRDLLSQAHGHLELPLVEGNTRQSIAQQGHERNLQYESVGKYIVQRSQILIALWDGVENNLMGGTAAVVRFQREGLPQSQYSLDPLEGFPVYQIVTPRKKNPTPEGKLFERVVTYPSSFEDDKHKARKYYGRMFHRIDEFNRYANDPSGSLRIEINKSKGYLIKDLDESRLSPESRADLERYALVDALALRFQAEKMRTERLLHIVVFAAFSLFVLFAHLTQHPLLLMLALLFVLFSSLWHGHIRSRDGDTRFEDYRVMAEGLRVRFFWQYVGLPDSVTDYYLGKQRTELDWIRNSFRGWDVLSDFAATEPSADIAERIKNVRRLWVDDQKSYFKRAAERDEDRLKRIEVWSKYLVYCSLAVAVGLLGFVIREWWHRVPVRAMFASFKYEDEDIPVVIVDITLAGAALLHNYANGTAYREHVKQYKRMEGIFRQMSNILDATNDPGIDRKMVKKLGEEALRESADWVLLHRERPLDVPHP
jgi:hypothetical protein